MTKRFYSPSTIAAPFGNYSHGAVVQTPGRWLFTSGQLAISKVGAIPANPADVPESALEQARLCFANTREILVEGGMGPQNVVRIAGFVTDRAYFADYMAARDEFVVGDPPVSTLLIVGGFTRPEFKVEVEVVAFAAS